MSNQNSIMSEQFWACSDILSGHFKNLISALLYCVKLHVAKILCVGYPIRITGGPSPGGGRVEIYYNNSWARICKDGWDRTDATLVCKQLLGSIYTGNWAIYGEGSGAMLLNGVRCGGQSNIFDCPHNGFGNHDCSRGGAGVRCSGSHGKCSTF